MNSTTSSARRPRAAAMVAALGCTMTAVALGPATAEASTGGVYVALGDSDAAGSVVFPQSELLTCARSTANYPSLVAKALQVQTFRDVTCASATTKHLTQPQPGNVVGVAPPQFDALSADTTLVTMSMGGNDIGIADDAYGCVNPFPAAAGHSCAADFTAGGRDTFVERTDALAATYGDVLEQIHQRAPHARVLVVGYQYFFRPGGCPAAHPISSRDSDYLQQSLSRLNAMVAAQAAAHNATYVDLEPSTINHDACAPVGDRWAEGIIPSPPTGGTSLIPVHPNAAGYENTARQILAALGH
ncbi:SGNH/GDSL hydrolase family protein [Nocardia sp. NPDC049149]|uniref:SGNH/GDSL hydrolase family protein n=1 Tax=Nocardia sp. NPDC049149 TaxID=3364315 RepID=UPI0037249DD6